jgi:S1-C subfamily serine protease
VLVKVGRFDVGSVEDLMFALGELRPKAKIKLVVLRDGKRVELDATVQEAKQKH